MIRLRVPAALHFRNLAVRSVAEACRLVSETDGAAAANRAEQREFDHEVVSAFGEAFNNVVIHSYAGGVSGDVEIEIELPRAAIEIRVIDFGRSFDLADVPAPDLDALPESGLGIFIMKSFMDEVSYVPGPPNVLRLRKRLREGTAGASHHKEDRR
jgi:serine/threonine-protein kinase RsbW